MAERHLDRGGATAPLNPFSPGEKVAGEAGRMRVFSSLRPDVVTG
jgi:hypothetical protein